MAGISTEEFLDRILEKRFDLVRLRGLQDGEFCLLLVADDGIFIHVNDNGGYKRYRKVENALDRLKRKTRITNVELDIALWKENEITGNF